MITIDTIIREQVNLFNGRATKYIEVEDREVNQDYLGVHVIDENQNQLSVFIPYDGRKPYTLKK